MYEVAIRARFAAAHRLNNYGGKCEALHGHNWVVEVGVQGETLDDVGLLLDFKVLKQHVHGTLEEIDHTMLNDHEYFADRNPSSELIAKWLHDQLSPKLDDSALTISFVRVWESEDSAATYRV